MSLLLRNVRSWGGTLVDIAMCNGTIAAIGQGLPRAIDEFDGRGGVVLPGLHDHHLHILATAARRQSVGLAGLVTSDDVRARLGDATLAASPGEW